MKILIKHLSNSIKSAYLKMSSYAIDLRKFAYDTRRLILYTCEVDMEGETMEKVLHGQPVIVN